MRPHHHSLVFSGFLPLLAFVMVATAASAATRHDLDTPGLAATINGDVLPESVVSIMQTLAQKKDNKASRADVVHALIDDRLLAARARQDYSVAELMEDNKVAYKPEVQLQQALVADIQSAFSQPLTAAVKAEKGGGLKGLVSLEREPSAADWNAVLGAQPKMLLEYALDEKGQAAAAKVFLLKYRLDRKTTGSISLLDVYEAQNVQGRNQLHARDSSYAVAQARLLLEQRYVLHWAQTRSGLSATDYAVFRRAVADRLLRDGWMALTGVSSDIHDDTENLKQLAAAVSPEEIRSYYEKNREQFRRIEKVKARHIRLADEKTAEAAFARLQQGESFDAVAKAVSLADDAGKGGDMGWIIHGEKAASWLDSLAFVQTPGVASKPFRSPGRPGESPAWEILLVEERVEGWQPVESESVRYVAAQAIARQKAMQAYRDTLEQVRREADIRLHPGLAPMARKGAAT